MVDFNASLKALENYDAAKQVIRIGPDGQIKTEERPGWLGRVVSKFFNAFYRFFGGDRPAERTAKKLMEIFKGHQEELQNNPESRVILNKLSGFMLKDSVSKKTQEDFTDFITKFSVAPQDAVSGKVNAVGSPLGKGVAVVVSVPVQEPVVDEEAERREKELEREHEQKVAATLQAVQQKEDEAKAKATEAATIVQRAKDKVNEANEKITAAKEEAARVIEAAKTALEAERKAKLAELDKLASDKIGAIDSEFSAKQAEKKKAIDAKFEADLKREVQQLETEAEERIVSSIAQIDRGDVAGANAGDIMEQQRLEMIEKLKNQQEQSDKEIAQAKNTLEATKRTKIENHEGSINVKKAQQNTELESHKNKQIEAEQVRVAKSQSQKDAALAKLNNAPDEVAKIKRKANEAFGNAVTEATRLTSEAEQLVKNL